jgi:hypothetical protein
MRFLDFAMAVLLTNMKEYAMPGSISQVGDNRWRGSGERYARKASGRRRLDRAPHTRIEHNLSPV